MKILWIVQRDLHQDLNVATWLEMTKSLANRDHKVTLVALTTLAEKYPRLSHKLCTKELRVIKRFPFVAISFHLQILIFSLYWLFAIRPDVVITHPVTALFLLPAIFVAKILKLKVKFVVDIRTLPVRFINLNDKIKNALVNASIHAGKLFFDGITTITPALQRIISQRYNIDSQKIGIWMSGVNIDLFHPKKMKTESSYKFSIMYHGVLAANRGIIETIQAMVEVKKKLADVRLLILGKGLEVDKMKKLIDQLNLNGAVQFHDAVDYHEIPDFISRADVGIIPLPDELCWRVSSPLKLIEYLAMEKPVIVSPIEAHTSFLSNCPAAIFIKSTRPEDISAGIIEAYTIRKQLPGLGKEGRKFVMNNFTWDHQAANLEKFIKELT